MGEPEFTDTGRAALLWVLWHHQGASSPVGQAMRFALGMGQHDHMSDEQLSQAKSWAPPMPCLAHMTHVTDLGPLVFGIKGVAALLYGKGAAEQSPTELWMVLNGYIDQLAQIVGLPPGVDVDRGGEKP